jgi:glycosyltransferase involved in cell wall biosynthesis
VKIALVAHGYPPELVGGTESSVQALARGLARQGDDVVVIAGTLRCQEGFRTSEEQDEADGRPIRVRKIHRADLYFDHWQKSASAKARAAFREMLVEEKPDVVHVHHWIRLSRDLVATAASLGIPSVVSLHDFWSSCLVTFRVRPDTKRFCEVPLAPDPCLACAALVPPRAPWVEASAQRFALEEHRRDIRRELELARAVLVPSRTHGELLARFLALPPGRVAFRTVPLGRDLDLRPREPLPAPGVLGRLVLGSWGHLYPLKGQDLLIGAVRRLSESAGAERVELHLAGAEADPEFARALRESARDLRVRFHGPFRAEELSTHPCTAVHAMVSGSRASETWGLVLDEALALRIPMVLPRSGAFPERLAEGRGALFYAPGDELDLARVLERLRAEPGAWERLSAALPRVEDLVPTSLEHLELVRQVYAEVARLGPPPPPASEWWKDRLQAAAEEAWDRSLSTRSREELGF